jgi:hypothetical protein
MDKVLSTAMQDLQWDSGSVRNARKVLFYQAFAGVSRHGDTSAGKAAFAVSLP